MIIIADQHHMNDLEYYVMGPYGKDHKMRLMGDITPTQLIIDPDSDGETILKLYQKQYKESNNIPINQELSFPQKIEAHAQGIENEFKNKTNMEQLITFYGGASITSFARKYFSAHHCEDTLCHQGGESLIEQAQKQIFENLINRGISEKKVLEKIITILMSNISLQHIITEQFMASGLKTKLIDFLLKKFDYKSIPTCLDVLRRDDLDNFKFIEKVYVERQENSLLIHVPYFSGEEARMKAINEVNENLAKDIDSKYEKGVKPVVLYHGNPYPKGMDDPSAQKRVDYNLALIERVMTIASEEIRTNKMDMFCAHLHKKNKPYEWNSHEHVKIRLIPLGITDYAVFDTLKGKIKEIKSYK